MTRLIEDLLDMSRIVTGKLALALERIELSAVVMQVVDTWRNAGRLSRHDATAYCEEVWVKADRARVEQIVSNLLDNALKFTPTGRRIIVGVKRDGAHARIIVADEGVGIASADLERVFDLFAQAPQELSRPHGGIGVGLTLAKRLAEMQGGSVAVASAGADRGSTFTITLPVCDVPAADNAETRTSARRNRLADRPAA